MYVWFWALIKKILNLKLRPYLTCLNNFWLVSIHPLYLILDQRPQGGIVYSVTKIFSKILCLGFSNVIINQKLGDKGQIVTILTAATASTPRMWCRKVTIFQFLSFLWKSKVNWFQKYSKRLFDLAVPILWPIEIRNTKVRVWQSLLLPSLLLLKC